jgi:uncharacterized paraquat-inducible protein A
MSDYFEMIEEGILCEGCGAFMPRNFYRKPKCSSCSVKKRKKKRNKKKKLVAATFVKSPKEGPTNGNEETN